MATKKQKKPLPPPPPTPAQLMALWNAAPQAVKDAIDDRFGIKIKSEYISDDFNPSDSWFSVSTWEGAHGMIIESMNTSAEVESLISNKLSRDEDDGFDLFICDSTGQEYTWQTQITLVKV